VVVVCGSVCGLRNKIGRKLGGKRSGGWKRCCQGPDVRADGRMSGPGRMSGLSSRMSGRWIRGRTRRTPRGEVKSGAKFEGICGWNLGKRWGKARSTCNTRNPRIKSNKTSSHQQITKKKLGLFLWGNFRIRTKNNKIKLENKERGLRNRDQRGS
jgi:hypothetical protein